MLNSTRESCLDKIDSVPQNSNENSIISKNNKDSITQGTVITDSNKVKSYISTTCSSMNEAHRNRVQKY